MNRLLTTTCALVALVLLPLLLTAGWQTGPVDPPRKDGRDFIYGRIVTTDGDVYEGRLRWGGDEEAYWDEHFNGAREENPWTEHVSPELLKLSRPVEIFGFQIGTRQQALNLNRPFMARFGDIARIDTKRSTFTVTLKSGTVHTLNRFAADDLADGIRVWDATRGVLDMDEWAIRSIEFLPTPTLGDTPDRLHGTVHTSGGSFTGFIQWNREEGVATDELNGRAAAGDLALPFHSIDSISRDAMGGSVVSLLDGRQVTLSGTAETGEGNRGAYVNDARFGRVLVSWTALERANFSPGGSGPSFEEFPPGVALSGTVTTCGGRRLTGRLVYDLDESETTETLDASREGVDYSIPFGLLSAIQPDNCGNSNGPALVHFRDGHELSLERQGDLGDNHAGMLIFENGSDAPVYVSWREVDRVDLERP